MLDRLTIIFYLLPITLNGSGHKTPGIARSLSDLSIEACPSSVSYDSDSSFEEKRQIIVKFKPEDPILKLFNARAEIEECLTVLRSTPGFTTEGAYLLAKVVRDFNSEVNNLYKKIKMPLPEAK